MKQEQYGIVIESHAGFVVNAHALRNDCAFERQKVRFAGPLRTPNLTVVGISPPAQSDAFPAGWPEYAELRLSNRTNLVL